MFERTCEVGVERPTSGYREVDGWEGTQDAQPVLGSNNHATVSSLRKSKAEAFCCATSFEEFSEQGLKNGVAAGGEIGLEGCSGLVEDNGVAGGDGVAGEVQGVFFRHGDALVCRVEALDGGQRGLVEGGWEVEEFAAGEWGEAGIEVVEARVNEAQGGEISGGAGTERIAERGVAGQLCAPAVAGPQVAAVGSEEGVAFAFKRRVGCGGGDGEAFDLKPLAEEFFFALAFGVAETAEDELAAKRPGADKSGVGGENHVRQGGLGLDFEDVGDGGNGFAEAFPLLDSEGVGGCVEIAFHPGIDDIVDVKKARGTHEERGA